MPWMSAVTAIRVVVARMMPRRVRKLRNLFLRKESRAMREASQKEALRRNLTDRDAMWIYEKDADWRWFVPRSHYLDGGAAGRVRRAERQLARRRPDPASDLLHGGRLPG